MFTLPYTLNSKCIANKDKKDYDAEVKIIQKFDSSAIPTIDTSLLREFRLYLADIDI